MSRLRRWKSLKLVVVLLAPVAVLVAVYLSQYPVRQAAALRRQLASSPNDLQFEKRVQLETAILQYETDNRIKIWTAIVQAAGGGALLLGLWFTWSNLKAHEVPRVSLMASPCHQIRSSRVQALESRGILHKSARVGTGEVLKCPFCLLTEYCNNYNAIRIQSQHNKSLFCCYAVTRWNIWVSSLKCSTFQ
jgi:hypothetical protein